MTEDIDSWWLGVRAIDLGGGRYEYEASLVHEGSKESFRARGKTREEALGKLAELHNPMLQRLGLRAYISRGKP